MHVLVIEDHQLIAETLRMVLQTEGFSVDVANDGGRGLELARRSEPDVIVLDVMMPGMDGWEVAETLQQDPGLAAIPIVFCTAKSGRDSIERAKQLGAAAYVTKPFDNDVLIRELIRASSPTSPRCP